MELLDMVEDFGATPNLGVYDGYAADDEWLIVLLPCMANY
jgi:hypothetical protein